MLPYGIYHDGLLHVITAIYSLYIFRPNVYVFMWMKSIIIILLVSIKSLGSVIFLGCDHYISNLLFRVLLIDFYK